MRLHLFALCTAIFSVNCSASWWDSYDLEKTAVVIKPYADLFIQSAQQSTSFKPATALYRHQALSCEPTISLPCTRAHQALFNEIMVDARIEGNEVVGRLPNAVYGNDAYDPTIKKPLDLFYADARSVVFLSDLVNQGSALDLIPCPSWDCEQAKDQNTITLMVPWIEDGWTHKEFSAGTRFVRFPQHDTFTHYAVIFIDYKTAKWVLTFLPKSICVPEHLKKHSRLLFVTILKSLLEHAKPGLIPYVWGGSSFIQSFPDKPYALMPRTILNQNVTYYERMPVGQKLAGFDCSELVWRVAQMAGLNYRFKNTGMIDQEGQPLRPDERLQAGDLIWIRGHVMIANDVVHNKLVEAAGYGAGFGRVQEIGLAKRMYGISTYNELEDAYRKHNCLMLLKADGNNATSCKPFKLVKLIDD